MPYLCVCGIQCRRSQDSVVRPIGKISEIVSKEDRGGMCLTEGAVGCAGRNAGKCCDGLKCHSQTGICLGKDCM